MLTEVHWNPVSHLGLSGPQFVAKRMVSGFGEEPSNGRLLLMSLGSHAPFLSVEFQIGARGLSTCAEM